MRETLTVLIRRLLGYAEHQPDCNLTETHPLTREHKDCTCGLIELAKTIDVGLSPGKDEKAIEIQKSIKADLEELLIGCEMRPKITVEQAVKRRILELSRTISLLEQRLATQGTDEYICGPCEEASHNDCTKSNCFCDCHAQASESPTNG